MNNGVIQGRFMGVSVNGVFISCETESSMQFEREMLPASSVSSGDAKEFIQGKYSWSVTVSGNLLKREAGADFKTIYETFLRKEMVMIQFRTRPVVDQFLIFEGNAFVQLGNVTAPNRGRSNWSVTFQGNGILGMTWEEFWTIINAMPAPSDQPTYIDTTQW